MIEKLDIENLLFFDIETVPEIEDFKDLDPTKKELFDLKTKYQRKEEFTVEEFYDRAGIWAEFGKIICISVGYFTFIKGEFQFRITTLFGDEPKILSDFTNLIDNHFSDNTKLLCGHNIKEFDIPYISRRLLINGMKLPGKLNLMGKKPWEIPHLDTLELWKFGDYKHFTSLNLLANVLGIPSPKDDIDGSEVAKVYFQEKDLDRIIKYCEKDVLAVAQVFLKLRGDQILRNDQIKII
jgi:hypothetical protein